MQRSSRPRETRALLRSSRRLSRSGTWPVRYGPAFGVFCLATAFLARLNDRPLATSILLAVGCASILTAVFYAFLHTRHPLSVSLRVRSAIHSYLRRGQEAGSEVQRMLRHPVRSCILASALMPDDQERVRRALLAAGAWRAVEAGLRTAGDPRGAGAAEALAWLDPARAVVTLSRVASSDDPRRGLLAAMGLADIDRPDAYESLLDLLERGDRSRSRVARLLESSRYGSPLPHLERRSAASSPAARFWIRYLTQRQRGGEERSVFATSDVPEISCPERVGTVRSFLQIAMEGARTVARILVVAAAWLVFFYWWSVVLEGVPWPELVVLGSLITVALGAIALIAVVWIAHNVKVALRGSRGSSTRYVPPVLPTDALGRELWIGSGAARGSGVSVSVREGSKRYEIAGYPARAESWV